MNEPLLPAPAQTPTWWRLAAHFGGRTVVHYTEVGIALMNVTRRTASNLRYNGKWPTDIPITAAGMVDLVHVATWWERQLKEAGRAA